MLPSFPTRMPAGPSAAVPCGPVSGFVRPPAQTEAASRSRTQPATGPQRGIELRRIVASGPRHVRPAAALAAHLRGHEVDEGTRLKTVGKVPGHPGHQTHLLPVHRTEHDEPAADTRAGAIQHLAKRLRTRRFATGREYLQTIDLYRLLQQIVALVHRETGRAASRLRAPARGPAPPSGLLALRDSRHPTSRARRPALPGVAGRPPTRALRFRSPPRYAVPRPRCPSRRRS